jgi:hypothetical protein
MLRVYTYNKQVLMVLERDYDVLSSKGMSDKKRLALARRMVAVGGFGSVQDCCRFHPNKCRWAIRLPSGRGWMSFSETEISFPQTYEDPWRIPEQGLRQCLPLIRDIRSAIKNREFDDVYQQRR